MSLGALGAAAARRVAVIGAGMVGVSAAYHLAAAGARVSVLDRAAPGSGSTQGAFAMLIATHEDGGRALNDFYGAAVADWRRLERERPGAFAIQRGGTLSWAGPGPAAGRLRANLARALAYGAPIRAVERADFAALVPGVDPGDFVAGMFSPLQGTLDPSAAHAALMSAAGALGVQFRFPCEAVGFRREAGRITAVETSAGPLEADTFVLCGGIDAPKLAAMAGGKVPLNVVSGALAHTRPFRPVLGRVLNGPTGSIKQDPDGAIVTGLDYAPGATAAAPTQAYGEALLAAMVKVVPAAREAKLERVSLGYAPIPVDGMPAIGFVGGQPNVYAISTMSGITLAPILGRLAASEIVGGVDIAALDAWRPDRFG